MLHYKSGILMVNFKKCKRQCSMHCILGKGKVPTCIHKISKMSILNCCFCTHEFDNKPLLKPIKLHHNKNLDIHCIITSLLVFQGQPSSNDVKIIPKISFLIKEPQISLIGTKKPCEKAIQFST